MTDVTPRPKVFISYSWTNEAHVDWVVRLAERLQGDGVHVVLDQWDLKEGQDKFVYMEQMVTDPSVNKILAICDQRYVQKANDRQGGVGTESQIISQKVYDSVAQEKFIPIIRERGESDAASMPVFFHSRIYIDFSDEEKFGESYDRLIRNLFGRPERARPPLGQPPAHLFVDTAQLVKPAGKLERLKDAIQRGKPHTHAMLQDYLDALRDSFEDFRIAYSRNDNPPFDERLVENLNSFLPYRDSFVDFGVLVASSMNDEDSYDRVVEFFQDIMPYQSPTWGAHTDVDTENYQFLLRELFLYFIITLLKSKRYAVAARFIEREYSFLDRPDGDRYLHSGIGAFDHYSRVLEEMRGHRLKLRPGFVLATEYQKRATHPKVALRDLIQTDLLLYIRRYFPLAGACQEWYPRLLSLAGRGSGITLELFAKATTDTGFRAIRDLFKVKTLADFSKSLTAMLNNQEFLNLTQSRDYFFIDWRQMLNVNRLVPQ